MSGAIAVMEEGRAFERRLARIEGRAEETSADAEAKVREILADVRRGGDRAVERWTKQLDGVDVRGRMEIPAEELAEAFRSLAPDVRSALRLAARRVRDYHRRQRTKSWSYRDREGMKLGLRIAPIDRAGLYVPGGSASYPSSVLMNAIPAKVAGVREVVAVSPPAPTEGSLAAVLGAAHVAGVDRFFRIGGAQAVAALAYGTKTVPRVDKIVGPGNVWVQTAKRQVFGRVGIDNFAGASEVLVVADGSPRPDWIAADLLSQAEHDAMASSVLVTTSKRLAAGVAAAVERQLVDLPRRKTAAASLRRFGAIFVVKTLDRAIEIANRIAPEHLELALAEPGPWVEKVRHAGAIFVGCHAPEPLGDYLAGPNHVLPTGGTARFASPLGVHDFIKRTSILEGSPRALAELGPPTIALARAEGLDAHANAVAIRLETRKH